MSDFNAILPNLQIGPIWLVAGGVVLGFFLARKFPNILPSFFAPSAAALTADDIRAIIKDEIAASKK